MFRVHRCLASLALRIAGLSASCVLIVVIPRGSGLGGSLIEPFKEPLTLNPQTHIPIFSTVPLWNLQGPAVHEASCAVWRHSESSHTTNADTCSCLENVILLADSWLIISSSRRLAPASSRTSRSYQDARLESCRSLIFTRTIP